MSFRLDFTFPSELSYGPLVSVLIPCFNAERRIARALERRADSGRSGRQQQTAIGGIERIAVRPAMCFAPCLVGHSRPPVRILGEHDEAIDNRLDKNR